MPTFKKKPKVVDAVRYLGCGNVENHATPEWLFEALESGTVKVGEDGSMIIETLEGQMTVSDGDWIIRGLKGELYPCKPDIFAETYEPTEEKQESDQDVINKLKARCAKQEEAIREVLFCMGSVIPRNLTYILEDSLRNS